MQGDETTMNEIKVDEYEVFDELEKEPGVQAYLYFFLRESSHNGVYTYDKNKYIRFDKAYAFEWGRWPNKTELLGFASLVFQPTTASAINECALNHPDEGNTIIAHRGHVVILWDGVWSSMEKLGLTAGALSVSRFPVVAKEINSNFHR
jgi:hypothetical protein